MVGCDRTSLSTLARLDPSPFLTPDKTVTITLHGVCAPTGLELEDFFVIQTNYVWRGGERQLDRDGDGLSDIEETASLLDPNKSDSNGDGYSDLVAFLTGNHTRASADLPRCINPGQDTDGDGIADCGELMLGTDPLSPDEDGDGIVTWVERSRGLDDNDATDVYRDRDGDGKGDYDEMKQNLPVDFANDDRVNSFGLSYQAQVDAVAGCRTFTVRNVSVADLPVSRLRVYVLMRDGQQHRRSQAFSLSVAREQMGGTVSLSLGDLKKGVLP